MANVNRAACHILRLFALVWLALGLGVPVSAWTVHDAAHGAAQVSVDTHHHHDEDGSVSVHDHDDNDTPDGGHDHMPSLLLSAIAMPDAGFALSAQVLIRVSYPTPQARGAERHASDGLRRPPRLG